MPSGGRGEYEVVGKQNGHGAADLDSLVFVLRTSFGDLNTHLHLSSQGGKRRLRSEDSSVHPQIQRQIASLLMLPTSTRSEASVSSALPILLAKRYIMDIEFTLLNTDGALAVIEPTVVVARSGDINDELAKTRLDYQKRASDLALLYTRAAFLPAPLNELVTQHFSTLYGAEHISLDVETKVKEILAALSYSDYEYLPGSDPLPLLKRLAGISATELVIPSPVETPSDDTEIRLRSEHIYRSRRIRSAAATAFKREVQRNYDFRCAFCGLRAPQFLRGQSPGVDAAHILPYGDFELDIATNGIMLCKQHHWAFDSHVLLLSFDDGNYYVTLNDTADKAFSNDAETLAILRRATGLIDESRLPRKALRPNPLFIEKLYATS